MSLLTLVQISAFIFGVGLGVKLYLWYTKREESKQNEAIIEQKTKIDQLMGRAEQKKIAYQDSTKKWTDFVNRHRRNDERE